MSTVDPRDLPVVDVGNDVRTLEGINTIWTQGAQGATFFTRDSPIDPEDGGTRLVFRGDVSGGSFDTLEVWYTTEDGEPVHSSTWTGFSPIELTVFAHWVALDTADPPDIANGEIGAGAAMFTSILFGGADTLIGTDFPDTLLGYDGNDNIYSAGAYSPNGEGEFISGGAGNDAIRLFGMYIGQSTISGDNNTDTLFVIDNTNVVAASLSSFERIRFDSSIDASLFLAADQFNDFAAGTIVTGSVKADSLVFVANVSDTYDLEAMIGDGDGTNGQQYVFNTWDASDLVSLTVADLSTTDDYVFRGNIMANALTGGNGDDQLNGDAGSDVLFGGGGQDLIEGDAGDDAIISFGDFGIGANGAR